MDTDDVIQKPEWEKHVVRSAHCATTRRRRVTARGDFEYEYVCLPCSGSTKAVTGRLTTSNESQVPQLMEVEYDLSCGRSRRVDSIAVFTASGEVIESEEEVELLIGDGEPRVSSLLPSEQWDTIREGIVVGPRGWGTWEERNFHFKIADPGRAIVATNQEVMRQDNRTEWHFTRVNSQHVYWNLKAFGNGTKSGHSIQLRMFLRFGNDGG